MAKPTTAFIHAAPMEKNATTIHMLFLCSFTHMNNL